MSAIALENSHLRAVIDPGQGAGLLAFHARRGNAWLALMPDSRREECDLACASFLMIPYANRLENGAFTFQGQAHQLAHGERHAIHGDVRKRPWKVGEHTGQRLVCAFHSADHQNVNWPWPFAARSTCALGERTLSMRLALWNQGATPMPAGLGWHPYFNRALTCQGEPVHLRFKVQGAYPDAHGNRIPSGPPHPPLEHQDFSSDKPLAPENFLDTCFCGYDGNGHIAWPQSNVRLRFACSAACSHLVIYNPQGKPYFAVEPVSNANNGVNLLARGDSTSGVVVLEPGQSLEAGFELHLEEVA